MFSLSKGEPPTPPSTATTIPPTTEHRELQQLRKTEPPIRSQLSSAESSSSTDQQETESGVILTESVAMLPDSGYEASPGYLNTFEFIYDSSDVGSDNVFESEEDEAYEAILLEREDGDDLCPDCGESSCCCSRAESTSTVRAASILLEREDGDDLCPECGESSCSCSRAESSATVRAAVSSYTDPNTCDSDSSCRSSSPQSPPPSNWSIPVSCPHIHNDRLPCPRCSRNETVDVPSSSSSHMQNIVASRSYPGSYPAALLTWWRLRQRTPSSSSPRVVAAAVSRTSNRSDDRRSTRSRRRQIDSDASSSSSCDENSADEVFSTACEEGSYLDNLGTMTEAEDLRVSSPEQLPDLVPLSSESSSRRVRSQSVSIPLDQEYLREIGISLRRLSNEFESRYAERHGQPRRSSLTSFLNLNWRS